jgi:hypothetical protein
MNTGCCHISGNKKIHLYDDHRWHYLPICIRLQEESKLVQSSLWREETTERVIKATNAWLNITILHFLQMSLNMTDRSMCVQFACTHPLSPSWLVLAFVWNLLLHSLANVVLRRQLLLLLLSSLARTIYFKVGYVIIPYSTSHMGEGIEHVVTKQYWSDVDKL